MMAESAADLQKQLDSFSDYCDIWRLKVNVEKKIVIFSQLRTLNNIKFNFNGKQLEIVKKRRSSILPRHMFPKKFLSRLNIKQRGTGVSFLPV
jgi:hypothetical protein